jgi:hypothetical protein
VAEIIYALVLVGALLALGVGSAYVGYRLLRTR